MCYDFLVLVTYTVCGKDFLRFAHLHIIEFFYLFVFSLGLTALLVAVGIFSGVVAALPRAGAWTLTVKRVGGILLLGMAEYYFVRAGTVL